MNSLDIFRTLEFSQEWIDLEIITPAKLREFEVIRTSGGNTNTEHYRWRAFLDFVESKKLLDEHTVKALYNLGANDPDTTMGGSIMAHILRRNDCPKDLLESAAKSDEKFLRKLANKRLAVEDTR